jgi:hypothetical protein
MALNILLIPAALSHKNFSFPPVAFDILSGIASSLAIALILHYHRRMSGARIRSHGLIRWITTNSINISAVTGIAEDRDHPTQDRDGISLFFFGIVLTWSIVVLAACFEVAA